MQIKIIKPGLLTSIQDLGRPLFRGQAVPIAGAMDQLSARLANKIIGNHEGAAVIEFTYANASFVTQTDVLVAFTGYGAQWQVNGLNLPANRPVFMQSGTSVTLVSTEVGARSYLAVLGGWQVPDVLGSKSTYLMAGFGGYQGRVLKTDDVLKNDTRLSMRSKTILDMLKGDSLNYPKWSIANTRFLLSNQIKVVPAQEFTWFDSNSIINFLSKPFTLTNQSNRMGLNFDGSVMDRIKKDELLSTAVTMGTVQVNGEGNLILLMAEGQTTGGYPRIAQVAAVDLHLCAQLKPNDQVFFKEISREEAETLYLEREIYLKQLAATIEHQLYIK
jgi:antagonist of KipI